MRRLPVGLLLLVVTGACVVAGLAAGARKPPPFAQTGNYRPVASMQLSDSTRLADNLVGDAEATYDPAGDCGVPDRSTCALGSRYETSLGFKWVHVGFAPDALNWPYVEREPGRYTIDAAVDQLVNNWAAAGITVVLTLQAGTRPNRPDVTRFADPQEIERFERYVRFMVGHFKGRIRYFEIGNEPDLVGEIPVAQYVNLVKHVIPVIRAEDPTAKIVVGATGGSGVPGQPGYGSYSNYLMNVDYLKTVITSGVAPLADVISWHPFFGSRADDPWYRDYPRLVDELRQLARSQGFTGQFHATEMYWRPVGDDMAPWQQPNSLVVVDKYLLRTITMHRGLDFVAVIGTPQGSLRRNPHPIHAINNLLAGVTPATVRVQIATKAQPLRSYGFTRANGERMLALWADGLPRDSDPGVLASLTFPGQAGHTATALDPLRAQQQKLVTTRKSGSLVIRNLLVRDYPLFVRLGR